MSKNLFAVLQFRDARLFLLGGFISFVGSAMQFVGIGWHVYALTHSAYYLGLLGVIGLIPTVISFLPAGVIIDKYHKRNLLYVIEAVLGILAFLLFFLTVFHMITVWAIFAILFIQSLFNSAEIPARVATIPLITPKEHRDQAMSIASLSRQAGNVIGPALAGFFIGLYGVGSIYLLNALSFFFLLATVFFITIPRVTAQIEVTKAALSDGLRFVKNNSLIGVTMLLDFLASFFAGATVLLPVFAKDIYHVGAQELGLLYAAQALGAIIVGLYLSSRKNISHQGKLLLAAVGIYAIGTIGFGLSKVFLVGFIFLAITGAGDMISTIIRNIIRQRLTPVDMQGRVLSTVMLFVLSGPYLGDAEAGFVAGFFGAPASVVIGGIVALFVVGGIGWKVKNLRTYSG